MFNRGDDATLVALIAGWALLILAILGIARICSATRRMRRRRRHSAPIQKYLSEISAGSVSEETRREFKEWARRVTEAAMRQYEHAPTKMRADAEKLGFDD